MNSSVILYGSEACLTSPSPRLSERKTSGLPLSGTQGTDGQ